MNYQWMLLVAWLADRCRSAPAPQAARAPRPVRRGRASLALADHDDDVGLASHHGIWTAEKGMTPEDREGQDFLVYFQTVDFFPWELREAAAYLREHTSRAIASSRTGWTRTSSSSPSG